MEERKDSLPNPRCQAVASHWQLGAPFDLQFRSIINQLPARDDQEQNEVFQGGEAGGWTKELRQWIVGSLGKTGVFLTG